jgi:hypothetical protein
MYLYTNDSAIMYPNYDYCYDNYNPEKDLSFIYLYIYLSAAISALTTLSLCKIFSRKTKTKKRDTHNLEKMLRKKLFRQKQLALSSRLTNSEINFET